MKLLLFDIDGTLIRSSGAGRAALGAALTALFGSAGPIADYHMSGKTDARIIADLLTAIGVPPAEIEARLPEVCAAMAEHAGRIFPEHTITACPGVAPLLDRLAARDDVLLGLLTGNASRTAPLKLAAAAIDPALFRCGAYGCDHADRNQLPAIAMQRAAQLAARPFTGADTVIIGDTPADIVCAHAGQATAVAVASGWHASSTLAAYHPDHLFENLADTDRVLAALLPPVERKP
ncbi:MAG: haloacid dehalogenase-like hydrolase [Anaerolineales bacterium]|nr:haloacid dehalogenase-like hydrolase [Anaerolineales bacterium]